jgi:hypothetical protein
MTRPLWRDQFPAFPGSDIPVIPAGWRDVSFRHDACPCFAPVMGDDGAPALVVFVDRVDPEKREYGAPRFLVGIPDDPDGDLYHGDDWQAALAAVAAFVNGGAA